MLEQNQSLYCKKDSIECSVTANGFNTYKCIPQSRYKSFEIEQPLGTCFVVPNSRLYGKTPVN